MPPLTDLMNSPVKRILIIDDEIFIREPIRELLEEQGYKTLGAMNGQEGIRVAQTYIPDLILCDIQMPDIDGYTVLSTLQQSTRTATIPFIFLTAKAAPREVRYGMNLGADDYLTKPFTVADLFQAITKRLEKQRAHQVRSQQMLDTLRSSIALSFPHEFRTPLSGILTATEFLRVVSQTPDQTTLLEIADNIQTSVERLQRLVQNFLLYVDLELLLGMGKNTTLSPGHAYSPTALVTRVATQQAKHFHREADLRLELHEGVLAFPESDLEKVLEEVVGNAFKFSSPGSPVWITNQIEQTSYTLAIRDQGRGMTPDQIISLGAYLQFDREVYEQQGIGLGLAIVRYLLNLYKATLQIESVPDEHTTLKLSFVRPIFHSPE